MKLNNKKGISLIVLVITIIVMIVLAAAIILSLQSSGIIGRANEAKAASDVANAKQIVAMANAEWQLDEEKIRKENIAITTFKQYAESKLTDAGYKSGKGEGTYEVTEDGAVYPYPRIPKGFVASKLSDEDNVSEGLVIYEIPNDTAVDWNEKTTLDEKEVWLVQTIYNQYVWIPVDSISSFTIKNWGAGKVNSDNQFTDYLSRYDLENSAEAKEYADLFESVKENGGFYIARYEAGLPSEITLDDSATANYGQKAGDLTKPVSIKGTTVWNNIPWDGNWVQTQTTNIYGSWDNPGAAKVAKSAYSSSSDIVSHLIYGEEWDAALKFISKYDSTYAIDSEGRGWNSNNSDGEVKATGIDLDINQSNKIKNIYDMSGNVEEWSMEGFTPYRRVVRGSSYLGTGISANREPRNSPSACAARLGFRVALYLK